jgi:hypothetical protein
MCDIHKHLTIKIQKPTGLVIMVVWEGALLATLWWANVPGV